MLVPFLYLLMRDWATPGMVAKILEELTDCPKNPELIDYSNKHLAAYAMEVAERIAPQI
jgi:hypothetical protein